MYTIVGKDPLSDDLEVFNCETSQDLQRRTAHYDPQDFIVLSKCKVLKDKDDTVVKNKGKKPWVIGIK